MKAEALKQSEIAELSAKEAMRQAEEARRQQALCEELRKKCK